MDGAATIGWRVLIWAGVVAIVALLLLPIATQAVRRRRFWCYQAQGEVEVECGSP